MRDSVCCLGGGALPFASPDLFSRIATILSESPETVVSNNLYSADITAFTPADALTRITLPAIDNPLPRLLRDVAGLNHVQLERGLDTLFDVDTPADLVVLSLYPHLPEALQPVFTQTGPHVDVLERAMACFTDKEARVTVAGRVGSFVWSRLETETACRCRVISEGRGMRASGDSGAGQSALGHLLDAYGFAGFFDMLADLGDAAFLDTRVLFNHAGKSFSTADRFHSDLLQPDAISDPWLREFTQAAMGSRVPVVLGGHSLVTGGLVALIDAAWARTF